MIYIDSLIRLFNFGVMLWTEITDLHIPAFSWFLHQIHSPFAVKCIQEWHTDWL